MNRAVIRCVGWAVMCLPLLCAAQELTLHPDFEETPWVEATVEPPSFPDPASLISFTVGTRSDTKFSVDGKTISVGGDGVIRYVLVVESAQGARNISFEGMRCVTTERRVYAYGRNDGTWSKARSDRWVPVRGGPNNHHAELYFNYFCARGDSAVMTPEVARRVLSTGGFRAVLR